MTNEDYSKVPPPHLLKKFSEQAREDSQKRGRPGYCKTFAKLCIDWAFQEELNSKSSPNNLQIRSSDLDVTIALVQQWTDEIYGGPGAVVGSDDICLAKLAAQYGADQELEACCHYFTRDLRESLAAELRTARRPKPPSLKEQALALIDECTDPEGDYLDDNALSIIRRALEQLPDHTSEGGSIAEQLSPTAQAVLDAYRSGHLSLNNLAAALEALANQVVPTTTDPRLGTVRSDICRIARELKGQ